MPYKDPAVQREYQRVWITDRREKFFKDKECAQADSTCEGRLELDHKNPSKKGSHRIWSYKWSIIEKETKKCQVLCSSHHFRKTANDVRKMRAKAHGTQEGFDKWRCRCPLCAPFKSSSLSQWVVGLSVDEANIIE